MLKLKGCPRCQGPIMTNKDMYGEYEECLQCGYMLDIEQPGSLFGMAKPELELATKTKKKAA